MRTTPRPHACPAACSRCASCLSLCQRPKTREISTQRLPPPSCACSTSAHHTRQHRRLASRTPRLCMQPRTRHAAAPVNALPAPTPAPKASAAARVAAERRSVRTASASARSTSPRARAWRAKQRHRKAGAHRRAVRHAAHSEVDRLLQPLVLARHRARRRRLLSQLRAHHAHGRRHAGDALCKGWGREQGGW
jgi:hypothetical protein